MRLPKSLMYILWQLCTFFMTVFGDETDTFDDVMQSQKLESIRSFFYMTEKEDLHGDLVQNNNYELQTSVKPCDCKTLSGQNAKEAIFYKRMIAVLLSNIVIQEVDDRVIGTLSIDASFSEWKYLQNFVNGEGSINEVDQILADAIKQSDYTACHYEADVSYYLNQLLEISKYFISVMKEHWNITIIACVTIVSFFVLRRQQWSRSLFIILLFDIIFVTSYFITWWRLIQEEEIKLMAAQAQFAEMPITCQPNKMGMWDKIVTFLWHTDDCQKYYETMMTNPKLQVTPMFVLTYLFSSIIFEPLSQFGLFISTFVENTTSKLNFLYAIPIKFIFFFSFGMCIILIPFLLLGGSFNLGFGPFFKFGIGREKSSEKREHIERIYESTSPKRLRHSKQPKQITLKQDPAGGDADVDMLQPQEKSEKCVEECNEKQKGHGDC